MFVITRGEHGGAQAHILDLIRGFRERFELHLAVGEEHFLSREARGLGVRVDLVPSLVQPLAPLEDWRALRKLLRLIGQVKPTLVHCHSSKAGFIGRLAARITGTPSIFTAHGWAFTQGVSWKRKIVAIPSEWFATRLGNAVITVSRYDYLLALRYGIASEAQMTVVHNGIQDMACPSRAVDAVSPTRLIMVARFTPPKDHASLLSALSGLTSSSSRWVLDLVGEGPLLASMQAEAARLGLEAHVRFLGARLDVARLLGDSSVFILTSNYEGLPISILEAMRAGLPVVASNVGGIRSSGGWGNGVSHSPRGCSNVEGTPGSTHRRSSATASDGAGRARYESCFTLEQMLEKTLAVYEKVLKTKVS